MNTDELLTALQPYTPHLYYGVAAGVWFCELLDFNLTMDGETARDALVAAWEKVKEGAK